MSSKGKRPAKQPWRRKPRANTERVRRFEEFEQRLVMSAAPLTDPGFDLAEVSPSDMEVLSEIQLTAQLNQTHSQTGVDAIHHDYGFDGTGQTVAIIDSGIAWDHYALGSGFGENARVVGGWDFAENDADPYDDGPAGYHGTHVSGIVASGDEDNPGVAHGVDLVGLRVFDDSGTGQFEWVEQALQWVHEHKDDFEHPITTVNLSIGSEWNDGSGPDWTDLEDEFAQLKADGIFISVAAGNSFHELNDVGLSYPAVSENVVPVASHDADGNMSSFSQRDDRVLVAPGEEIRSAIPDHFFGGSQSNQYLGASGTSMAAPYVAGASALLRQANEFMGVENIDQDLLYQQFRDTADQIWDSATSRNYYKMNIKAAIESVVTDQQGDNWGSSHDAGTLQNGTQISGTIGTTEDKDVFEFTASSDGRITLEFETTHELNALVDVQGINAQLSGNKVIFDVVAGQQYKFSVATSDGIGHYDVTASYSDGIESVNWGSVDARQFNNQQIAGQQWFRMTASNEGILSISGSLRNSGSLELRVYDGDGNEVAARHESTGDVRVDVDAEEGESFFVKAIAVDGVADFSINNLVSLENGRVVIEGTSQNDTTDITLGQTLLIDVNGTEYEFNASEVDSIVAAAGGGNDTLNATLDNGYNSVAMRQSRVTATSNRADIQAGGYENVDIDGMGGQDQLIITGSASNDLFTNSGDSVELTNATRQLSGHGFEYVTVQGVDGNDRAELTGTDGNDQFAFRNGRSILRTNEVNIVVDQFDDVTANGGGGRDVANLFDTAGDDQFVLRPTYGKVTTDDVEIRAGGFERINAFSSSGDDSLVMHDSVTDDNFFNRDDISVMYNGQFMNVATGFAQIETNAGSGNDFALLNGSNQSDTLYVGADSAQLSNVNQQITANGFERVVANSDGSGFDRAFVQGTAGADFVRADVNSTTISSAAGEFNRVVGFDRVTVDTGSGSDIVNLQGNQEREVLRVNQQELEYQTVMQELRVRGMDATHYDGNGGDDELIFSEFETLDLLDAVGDGATAYLRNHVVNAEDFALLEASTAAGETALRDVGAVDYLFMMRGDWVDVD